MKIRFIALLTALVMMLGMVPAMAEEVTGTAKGFGGDMSLMVGYHPDKTIRGVSIVSHAETPGVGSKVDDATYLSQYEGLSGGLTISKRNDADITSVSGATISSKAIHVAIEQASAALALVQ